MHYFPVILLIFLAANFNQKGNFNGINQHEGNHLHELVRDKLLDRYDPPAGYERKPVDAISFAGWLRNLPLKPVGSKVHYFDGRENNKPGVYDAVVDLPIGKKDLHQCADAVIRLRAEYLYDQGRYDEIKFHFTNGFLAEYSKWMEGYRIQVTGNVVSWIKIAKPSNTWDSFWKYLETVFTYAGTLSLAKELKPASVDEMQIGHVFIQGGSPGHAVIVVDMAENPINGKKVFMLAQSYMPAQEIQILQNPNDSELSPWYEFEFGPSLKTPDWKFNATDLKWF